MPIAEIIAHVVAESVIAVGTEAVHRARLGDDDKRIATWQALATRLGAQWITPEGGALPTFYGGFDVTRGSSLGHVEAHLRRTGSHTGAYTVAQAPFVIGSGPSLGVHRQGVMATLGKLFGSEDLIVGSNEEFDRAFVVRSGGDVDGTKKALTEDAQSRLLAHHRESVLSSDGKIATLAWRGFEHDGEKVEAALEVVLAVATCRADWLEEVGNAQRARRVEAAGGLLDRQPPSYAFDSSIVPVRAFPALLNTALVLRVHAKRERPSPMSVRVEIDRAGEVRGDVPEGLVPSQVAVRLCELGGARLGAEADEVWLDLPGAPSASRVDLAVSLVAAMAAGVEGSAFR